MTTEPELETYYVFENKVAEQILGMDTVDQIEFIFPPIDQIPEKHNLISFLFSWFPRIHTGRAAESGWERPPGLRPGPAPHMWPRAGGRAGRWKRRREIRFLRRICGCRRSR